VGMRSLCVTPSPASSAACPFRWSLLGRASSTEWCSVLLATMATCTAAPT
jgi:hypothetical protein